MTTIQTTSPIPADLDEAAVEAFKASLRGELLLPGDGGYDEARTLFNGGIDKKPAQLRTRISSRACGVAAATSVSSPRSSCRSIPPALSWRVW